MNFLERAEFSAEDRLVHAMLKAAARKVTVTITLLTDILVEVKSNRFYF